MAVRDKATRFTQNRSTRGYASAASLPSRNSCRSFACPYRPVITSRQMSHPPPLREPAASSVRDFPSAEPIVRRENGPRPNSTPHDLGPAVDVLIQGDEKIVVIDQYTPNEPVQRVVAAVDVANSKQPQSVWSLSCRPIIWRLYKWLQNALTQIANSIFKEFRINVTGFRSWL